MELFALPDRPVPSQPVLTSVATTGGLRLRAARWRPTVKRSHGTVVILQGRAEFIEKYFDVVAWLRRRGLNVVAFDWRGQGGSDRQLPDRRKGHVDDFNDFGDDLDSVIEQVLGPSCPKPWFVLAHSMGAAAFLLAVDRGEQRFERAVLSAPLTALKIVRFQRVTRWLAATLDSLALGGAYIPGGGATSISTKPFAGNLLTSDPVRYGRTAALVSTFPDLGLGDPTIGWVHAMHRAFDRFAERDFGRNAMVPTLWLLPGGDPLCDTPNAEALAQRVRGAMTVIVPGGRHELLFERDQLRDQALAAIEAFIPGQISADDLLADETGPDAGGDRQGQIKDS
jgi:lysophospholipase